MNERWLLIDLAPRYEVSNIGRVRNVTTKHFITPSLSHDGYTRVALRVGFPAKMKNFTVHKLVMRCFRGPRPSGKETDHKDRNRQNCKLSNLRYVTPDFNKKQRIMERGEDRHCAKLTEAKVVRILSEPSTSAVSFAREFGCDVALIYRIRKRTAWKHVVV